MKFPWSKPNANRTPDDDLKLFSELKGHEANTVFVAEGRIPCLQYSVFHKLVISPIEYCSPLGDDLFVPQIGITSNGSDVVRQLPVKDENDARCWADFLGKPYTHMLQFYYVPNNKKLPARNLLLRPVNCAIRGYDTNRVAVKVGKAIVSNAMYESENNKPRLLLDGVEVRVFGIWLIAAFVGYRSYWVKAREAEDRWGM